MKFIFEAWHYKTSARGVPDKSDFLQNAKCLGEFTTEELADFAIRRRSTEEGFRDWPHGFRIETVTLDPGFPEPEKLIRVHSLWHFRIGADDEDDLENPEQQAMNLGSYSSDERVKIAIERFRQDERFRDYPEGFRFGSAPPNIEHWAGGFVSWDDA